MSSEEILKQTFSEIGKEFGYEAVDAEFAAFKDFKVKWTRSYKWANFKVSDYLNDADKAVIEGLARTLFAKISGEEDAPYSDEMCQYLKSDEFVMTKQPVYVRRSRNLTGSPKGEYMDLNDGYARLVDAGLVEKDDNTVISWTKDTNTNRVAKLAGSTHVLSRSLLKKPMFRIYSAPFWC